MLWKIRSGYVPYIPSGVLAVLCLCFVYIFVLFLQMHSFVYDPSPVLSMFRQRSCSAQYVLPCSGLVCQFSIYVLFLICLMSSVSVLRFYDPSMLRQSSVYVRPMFCRCSAYAPSMLCLCSVFVLYMFCKYRSVFDLLNV